MKTVHDSPAFQLRDFIFSSCERIFHDRMADVAADMRFIVQNEGSGRWLVPRIRGDVEKCNSKGCLMARLYGWRPLLTFGRSLGENRVVGLLLVSLRLGRCDRGGLEEAIWF